MPLQGCIKSPHCLSIQFVSVAPPSVLGSDPEGKKPLEKPPENPPENQLEISYTGKSQKIGSLEYSARAQDGL